MADHIQIGRDFIAAWPRLGRARIARGDIERPCVGMFVMTQRLIKEWRDDFDLGTCLKAMRG